MQSLTRFHEISRYLVATAPLWRPRPFVQLPLPWEADFPQISMALRALEEPTVEAVRANLSKVVSLVPQLAELYHCNRALSVWPELDKRDGSIDPDRNPPRVPGRKWRQIANFIAVIEPQIPRGVVGWLDWCAGRGHLGCALSRVTGLRSRFVEKNEKLCGPDHVQADVLTDDLRTLFAPEVGAVALHACGNLNARLLTTANNSSCRFLAVAPCCYQKIIGQDYQPLSTAGQASALKLTNHHLRLVSFEEVVAGRGEKKRRARDHAFRLAFDLLAREVTGQDQYTPLGHLPAHFWQGSFERFARLVAERQGIELPAHWNPAPYERAGKERWLLNRALSLVRTIFARTVESWLLLDRVLFLQERGWSVAAGTFCARETTPRNLAILAQRH